MLPRAHGAVSDHRVGDAALETEAGCRKTGHGRLSGKAGAAVDARRAGIHASLTGAPDGWNASIAEREGYSVASPGPSILSRAEAGTSSRYR